MQKLFDSYKNSGNLHHAYFIVGDTEVIFPKLIDFIENTVKVKTGGNSDFWHGKFNTLTIDDVRGFSVLENRKDLSGGRKIFIIQTDFITEEAQNSMLKIIEEPTQKTHFFIISPQDILLSTLRSRVVTIIPAFGDEESQKTNFLKLKLKDRLSKIKEITEAISDEEKTKQDAINFLNEIELELHKKGVTNSARSLDICEKARAALYDRGAPIKIILENVVISI